jgi:hypothetical protein
MSSTRQTKAVSDCVVVALNIKIWCGEVTLRRNEDLAGVSGLPPKELVSDGSKRVIDPKHLTPLESQRRVVARELADMGVATPMGFIIAPEREAEVYSFMAEREQKFADARQHLLDNFDRFCLEWEEKEGNAPFQGLLRRNRPLASDVAKSCHFDYAVYKVEPVASQAGAERFAAVASTTTNALIADIASSADSILRKSFLGKSKAQERSVNLVRRLVAKLQGFAMFDPRIGPTADALTSVLDGLPKAGPVDASGVMVIIALLKSIINPDDLLAVGQRMLADAEEVDPTSPAPSKSPAPAVEDSTTSIADAVVF